MIHHFVQANESDEVYAGLTLDIPESDPILAWLPIPLDGYRYSEVPVPFVRDHQSPTAIPKVVGGAVVWIETATLGDLQAAAIAKTYPDVDAVYDAAIGRREPEYTQAEAAAREFLARPADSEEPVSDYITGHALNNPTGQHQTNAWAAQQIVERADAFRWAVAQMRNVRFARQADMRAATTPEGLSATVGEWNDFINWLRAVLGL